MVENSNAGARRPSLMTRGQCFAAASLLLMTACGPDDPSSTSESTQTSGDAAGSSSSEAASSESTGSGATESTTAAAPACTPMAYEVLEHNLLSTWKCAAIDGNAVFQSEAELELFLSEVCAFPGGCAASCDAAPVIDWEDSTVLVGYETGTAGSEGVFAWDILDCLDHVEVHFTLEITGYEQSFVSASEAVRVDKISVPIEFISESTWSEPP